MDAAGKIRIALTVLGMCAKWLLDVPAHIKNLEMVFPVTGNSFLPPDSFCIHTKKSEKI
jgi:hypothetical protein